MPKETKEKKEKKEKIVKKKKEIEIEIEKEIKKDYTEKKRKYIKASKVTVNLPENLANATADLKIKIRDGKAEISRTALEAISKQATDFVLRNMVYSKPVWSDRPDNSSKNPQVGVLVGRWFYNKQKKAPKDQQTKTEMRRKTLGKFQDLDDEIRNALCLANKTNVDDSD